MSNTQFGVIEYDDTTFQFVSEAERMAWFQLVAAFSSHMTPFLARREADSIVLYSRKHMPAPTPTEAK